MMTIILILCLGILIVNLYFFKAVCKSNDAINKSIDSINQSLKHFDTDFSTSIQVLVNNQRNMDKALSAIYSDIQNNIRCTNEPKIDLLSIINNELYSIKSINDAINLNIDEIKKHLEIIRSDSRTIYNTITNSEAKIVNIINNKDINERINNLYILIEKANKGLDLINIKSDKFNATYSKNITEELKWRENVAGELTEIYGEAVEAKKAIISLNSKPQAKPKKVLPKENESSK